MFPIRGKAAIWHPRAKLIFVKRTTVLQDSKAFCKELKFLWKTPDKFITTMRRKMFFAAALCCIVSAVMVSCGKDNPDTPEPEPTPDPEPEVPVTPKDTVVYAVGQEAVPGKGYYYATIWKDGKRILLSDGSYDAFCNGAYADGETIYIAGCEATGDLVDDGYYEPYHQNVGVIWKFKAGEEDKAEKTVISDGKYSTSPIAVTVADGKVYAAGFDTPDYDRRAILGQTVSLNTLRTVRLTRWRTASIPMARMYMSVDMCSRPATSRVALPPSGKRCGSEPYKRQHGSEGERHRRRWREGLCGRIRERVRRKMERRSLD